MPVSTIKDSSAAVERLDVTDRIPTDFPESDGTLAWDHTILVVEVMADDTYGLGYTYADAATARLISAKLVDVVYECDAMAVPGTWWAMVRAIRNLGRPGIASMAMAAVDTALWDLKARFARPAFSDAPRCRAGQCAGLWQRWLYVLFGRATG